MKKILSILSIGVFLSSSSSNLFSCNNNSNTKKLNLNNLKVFNLNVSTNSTSLILNYNQVYKKAELEILEQYNAFATTIKNAKKIQLNDFSIGTSTSNTPWAIQIYNINGSTKLSPISATNSNVVLQYTNKAKILNNNALNIKINTTNKNVVKNSATIKGYLNKFIYTNTNANKGINVTNNTQKNAF